MNIREYSKLEIAASQIETALSLFFQQGDLFSVITLAGAAEEILGQLLQHRLGKGELHRPVADILRPARRFQTEDDSFAGSETETSMHMDAYQEAVFLLGRAIEDYQAVAGTLSPAMRKFREERGDS